MITKKKVQRKNKEPIYISWDTETYKVLTEYIDGKGEKKSEYRVRPYLIGWFYNSLFFYSYEPHDAFFKFLEEKSKNYKLVLIAHNANYDLTTIIPEYLSRFTPIKFKYQVSGNETFIGCEFKCEEFSFVCADTSVWNVHIRALSNWLKLIGKPDKLGGIEYDKYEYVYAKDNKLVFADKDGKETGVDLAHELDYLHRDVEGTLEVYDYQKTQRAELFKLLGLTPKVITSPTSSSAMKRVINDKFAARHGNLNYFDETYRPEIALIERPEYERRIQSSCGGFSCCNKKHLKYVSPVELIQSYDVNSEYPFVMYHGVPIGEMLKEAPDKPHVVFYEIDVKTCVWSSELRKLADLSTPPLPSRWCKLDHTVYLLQKYYDVVKDYMETDLEIVDVYYMELCFDLKPLIKDMYKKKAEAKRLKDKQKGAFIGNNTKLGLNSIYGKMCEKTYEEETYYDWDLKTFVSDPVIPEFFRSPMGGVYIAQRSRALVIENILKEINNGNIFLYADTDSIKLVENNPVSLFVDNEILGAWKREGCGPNESRGYTNFLSTGKIKKWFLGNKNLGEAPKMAFSGITTRIKEKIRHHSSWAILEALFDPKKNIKVIGGKICDTKNSIGQTIIETIDICLNGYEDTATHELKFNEETEKYELKKINK